MQNIPFQKGGFAKIFFVNLDPSRMIRLHELSKIMPLDIQEQKKRRKTKNKTKYGIACHMIYKLSGKNITIEVLND